MIACIIILCTVIVKYTIPNETLLDYANENPELAYASPEASTLDQNSDAEDLTSTEKANIKRALTETGHFLAVMAIIGLIEWSDDKDRPWLVRMTEYQMRRLYTELGAMIPGKSMISEGLKIIKSPAAGVNTIENILDLTKLLNPWNYTDEIQSGRYEGHSTAYKSFFESPVIPMNRTIYRGLHPETGIPFFKQ